MNRRYIDFVPAHKVEKTDDKPTKAKSTSAKKQEIDELRISEMFAVREDKPRAGVTISKHPQKKPVAYEEKFVKTNIAKRPLGEDKDVAAAKARKLTKMPLPAQKAAPKAAPAPTPAEKKAAETMKVPKTNFVNTEKVAKRPLSKNVYQKKIVVPDEEPTGPVTIINKPEKDSRVGLIVTIIITIILGATAGTVAFLLLPK